MYPAFDWSLCAPGHHGYQRACDLISGQASVDHVGHQCSHAPGRPILHLVSNPLADLGRLGVSTIRVESRGLNLAGLEGSAMSQDAPSNAGELIGERDGKDVVMQSLLCRFDPRLKPIALPMLWPHLDQHHPGRLDVQSVQIAVAPFWYAAEDCSVSSRDLFRYQPKPRAEVAALRKRVSRSDCGHHRTRDDWPNAGYAHQPLAAFILPRQRFDLAG